MVHFSKVSINFVLASGIFYLLVLQGEQLLKEVYTGAI